MNKMVGFVVLGEPVAKGRPRVTKFGTYTPQKTVNYENLIKLSFKGEKLTGQLKMAVKAYFAIPKSTSKKKRKQMVEEEIRPTKKPDCDNVLKIICDALNTIAYDDDKQIVEANISKFYSEQPRIEVKIYGIEP